MTALSPRPRNPLSDHEWTAAVGEVRREGPDLIVALEIRSVTPVGLGRELQLLGMYEGGGGYGIAFYVHCGGQPRIIRQARYGGNEELVQEIRLAPAPEGSFILGVLVPDLGIDTTLEVHQP